MMYILTIYFNAIGNIDPPIYKIWSMQVEKDPVLAMGMILLCWFVWLCAQFLMLIMMFNFLIAIVCGSFDKVAAKQMIVRYGQKTKLNF